MQRTIYAMELAIYHNRQVDCELQGRTLRMGTVDNRFSGKRIQMASVLSVSGSVKLIKQERPLQTAPAEGLRFGDAQSMLEQRQQSAACKQ